MLNKIECLYKCAYKGDVPFFISSTDGNESPREVAQFVRDTTDYCKHFKDVPLTIERVYTNCMGEEKNYLFWSDIPEEKSLSDILSDWGIDENYLIEIGMKHTNTLVSILHSMWLHNITCSELDGKKIASALENEECFPYQLDINFSEFINSLKNVGIKEVTVECWADHGCMISERINIDALGTKSNINKITF